jgi:hypothetical protein
MKRKEDILISAIYMGLLIIVLTIGILTSVR